MCRVIRTSGGRWVNQCGRLRAVSCTKSTCWAQSRRISQSIAAHTPEREVDRQGPRVVIVGGGTGGINVAAQLLQSLKGGQYRTKAADITIVEPSSRHFYQPSWTLAACGLQDKSIGVKPMGEVMPDGVTWLQSRAVGFDPLESKMWMEGARELFYDYLVVACGLEIFWGKIKGLKEALGRHGVASVYSYDTCNIVWENVRHMKQGQIIFTQPSTPVKCAGAPQDVMWMAEDHFRRTGVRDNIAITFATGLHQMFAVPKYNAVLEAQRQKRGVEGLFEHNLVEIRQTPKEAVFEVGDGRRIARSFDVLHVTPEMGAPTFLRASGMCDESGYVSVNKNTLQHTTFPNVFAIGDCANLPTAKTAASISTSCPVLVHNLLQVIDGRQLTAEYDGYTSCPLLLGHGKLMLPEFKYGLEVHETLGMITDQSVPRRLFFHMEKDFFPWMYWRFFVKGMWFGPKGLAKPSFEK